MSYIDSRSIRNRPGSAAAAIAIQGLAAWGLISALGVALVKPHDPPKIVGVQIDAPKPQPIPSPSPSQQPLDTAPRDRAIERPINPPSGGAVVPPLGLGGTPGFEGTGGGLSGNGEDFVIPPVETPSASPIPARGPQPRGRPGSWVSQADYPSRDIAEGHEGLTRVRLAIGSDGRVSDCTITASSGWDSLDAAACARLKSRARFDPAVDGTGQPVPGSYGTSVRWELPE